MGAFNHEIFVGALLDKAAPVPPGLVGTADRFAIYRNNVASGLTGALSARFPILRRIVGDDFFRAMALAYAAGHPPRRAILLDCGDTVRCPPLPEKRRRISSAPTSNIR